MIPSTRHLLTQLSWKRLGRRGTGVAAPILLLALGLSVLSCTNAERIGSSDHVCAYPIAEVDDGSTPYEDMEHPLELTLDYQPENVQNPEILDAFLTRMVNALWDQDESTSYADHYWQWTQRVTADIDSLYDSAGMFHCDSLDRYEAAMQQIDSYLSDGGTQLSMNNTSYVYAICRNYLMHRKNIDLAAALPDVDIQQEYRLFNEYQSYAEDFWEEVHDSMFGYYSDRPNEVNHEAAERFDDRARQIDEILDVVHKGKTIQANGVRPSVTEIKTAFHEMMPGIMRPVGVEMEYPTDTIGSYFLKWVDYRDQLSSKMPPAIAPSYRNQTTNIILHQMLQRGQDTL